MTTLERAFPGQTPFLAAKKIEKLQYDKDLLETNVEHHYICTQIVTKLLIREPESRMTADEILGM